MKEEWRNIPGYEGKYSVSSFGRVKSLKRVVKRKGHSLSVGERELKQHLINSGRLIVVLSKNGVGRKYLVHRLVATAFLPNPKLLPQINHIDGNPLNNNVSNLEWCDQHWQEIHKIYNLGVDNPSLLAKPRKVLCVETKEVYRSLGEACRKTGVPMYVLFNRLKTSKQDNNGHHWVYMVN